MAPFLKTGYSCHDTFRYKEIPFNEQADNPG